MAVFPAMIYCDFVEKPTCADVSGLPVSSSPQLGEVVTTTRGSVLRISNALPPLHGTPVVCTAENALGHAEATARLFVYQNEEVKGVAEFELLSEDPIVLPLQKMTVGKCSPRWAWEFVESPHTKVSYGERTFH
ncbi:hypothetical protein ACTXT7_003597 [Hymenolepis weldensis]